MGVRHKASQNPNPISGNNPDFPGGSDLGHPICYPLITLNGLLGVGGIKSDPADYLSGEHNAEDYGKGTSPRCSIRYASRRLKQNLT